MIQNLCHDLLFFCQLKQLDVCFKYVVNEINDERNQKKDAVDIFWPMTRFFKYVDPAKAAKMTKMVSSIRYIHMIWR